MDVTIFLIASWRFSLRTDLKLTRILTRYFGVF